MKSKYKHIFLAWLPLGVMYIVMAAEQPVVNGVISRLPDAVNQLASFGYAFSLALLIEGPVVQMLSAGTAVSGTYSSYKKILKVMHWLTVITLSVHLLFCIPGVFRGFALHVMNLPQPLIDQAWKCFVFMIPWTPCIGYRRLWQGVLIKHGKSILAPIVMYVRLAFAFLFLYLGYTFQPLEGASLGGAIMGMVAVVGMGMAFLLSRPIIHSLKKEYFDILKNTKTVLKDENELSYRQMVRFYFPLAITSMVSLGVRPILNFGIPRGSFPIESLAAWPIVLSYVSLYTAVSQSQQEIVIAEMSKASYKLLQRFVTVVAFAITALFLINWFVIPFRTIIFQNIFGLPQQLNKFLPIAIAILSPLGFFAAKISWYRGVFISRQQTKTITAGIIVNLCTLLLFIIVLPIVTNLAGVYIATIAYTASFISEFFFLSIQLRLSFSI
ncbi:MAG: hypothetical protein BKP49_03885 [Treponema sp. CETP13]|nr:MAG: hypothetical protein BKP49_03885 [Treponema sp. CETP13]